MAHPGHFRLPGRAHGEYVGSLGRHRSGRTGSEPVMADLRFSPEPRAGEVSTHPLVPAGWGSR
jgi:hypothetical protein